MTCQSLRVQSFSLHTDGVLCPTAVGGGILRPDVQQQREGGDVLVAAAADADVSSEPGQVHFRPVLH